MKLFAMFIVASRPKSRSRRAVCDERARRYLRQVKSSSGISRRSTTSSVPVSVGFGARGQGSTLRSGAEAAVADTETRVTFRDAPIDRDQCSPLGSGHALRVVRSGKDPRRGSWAGLRKPSPPPGPAADRTFHRSVLDCDRRRRAPRARIPRPPPFPASEWYSGKSRDRFYEYQRSTFVAYKSSVIGAATTLRSPAV